MTQNNTEINQVLQQIPERLREELNAAHHVSPQTNRALLQFRKKLNLTDHEFVMLIALFTLSRGKREFNASFLGILSLLEEIPEDVAERLKTKEPDALKWGSQKVSRRLKSLSNRLSAQGLGHLLKYGGGGKQGKDGKRQVTQFKLELVPLVFESLKQAYANPSFYDGAQRAIDQQVDIIMANLPRETVEQRSNTKEAPKLLKEYRNMRTWLRLLDEMIAQGRKPDELRQHIEQAVYRNEMTKTGRAALELPEGESATRNEGLSSNMGARAGRATLTIQSASYLQSPSFITEGRLVSDERIATAIQSADVISMNGCYITFLDDRASEKTYTEQFGVVEDFKEALPTLLEICERNQWSLIVRPFAPDKCLYAQLDDLDYEVIKKARPISCLTIETSPSSYQSWVLLDSTDKLLVRQLKLRFGSDVAASGATRWPGSRNFKPKHQQPDGSFPIIQISHCEPGLVITTNELDNLDLPPIVQALDSEQPERTLIEIRKPIGYFPSVVSPHQWPRYEISLARAPRAKNHDGTDRSNADIRWCMTAYSWGWAVEAIAGKLMEVSEKAREKGFPYARHTAEQAGQYVQEHSSLAAAA